MNWLAEKEKLGKELVVLLYEHGAIKTWYRDRATGWILVSRLWSPFYIQLRPLSSFEQSRFLLERIGLAIWKLIQRETPNVNKLLGVAFTGIPIAIATTMVSGIPSCYTRKVAGVESRKNLEKEIGKYGEHALVEGELKDGDVVAVVDDVVTRFDSKLLAISKLEYEVRRRSLDVNIECNDVIVLIDREQGARERANRSDVNLHSLIPFRSKGIEWLRDIMADEEYDVISEYLRNPQAFQDKKVQLKLKQMARVSSARNLESRTKSERL